MILCLLPQEGGSLPGSEICEASHTWKQEGEYEIKVKAKDIYDYESEPSDFLEVKITKSRSVNRLLFIKYIQNFFYVWNFQLSKQLLNL